ncbi:MAG TPA: hypothetical protein DEP17_04770, partial [Lachnospiraceae bacterium]|nr:hypothetical protein [Lachnospiraceae bacterium]
GGVNSNKIGKVERISLSIKNISRDPNDTIGGIPAHILNMLFQLKGIQEVFADYVIIIRIFKTKAVYLILLCKKIAH